MDFPIDMREFKDAIHEWMTDAVSSSGILVVWQNQNAPQPPLPFIGMKVISGPIVLSPAWGKKTETDLSRNTKEIEQTTYVPCSFTISCQAWLDRSESTDTDEDAVAVLSAARAELSKQSVQDMLRGHNIAVVRSETPTDTSVLEEDSTVSRASMDVVFSTMLTATDFVTYIQKVELKSTALDVDDVVEI